MSTTYSRGIYNSTDTVEYIEVLFGTVVPSVRAFDGGAKMSNVNLSRGRSGKIRPVVSSNSSGYHTD